MERIILSVITTALIFAPGVIYSVMLHSLKKRITSSGYTIAMMGFMKKVFCSGDRRLVVEVPDKVEFIDTRDYLVKYFRMPTNSSTLEELTKLLEATKCLEQSAGNVMLKVVGWNQVLPCFIVKADTGKYFERCLDSKTIKELIAELYNQR